MEPRIRGAAVAECLLHPERERLIAAGDLADESIDEISATEERWRDVRDLRAVILRAGGADLPRVQDLLDGLVARYPRREDLVALQYKLLSAQPGISRDELRAHLLRAIEQSPDSRLLYSYVLQYHGADDREVTYDAIRSWMARDTRRRELSVVRRIFKQ